MYHIIVVGVVLEDTCTTIKNASSSKTPSSPNSLTSIEKFVLGMNADTGMNDADDDDQNLLQALVFRAVSSDESGRSLPRSSLSSDAAQHRASSSSSSSATTAILSGIQSRKTPLVSLLQKMDSTLTSDDDGVRASATALLAMCARTMSGMKNEEEEEEEEDDDDARQQRRQKGLNESLLLTQFFAAKLRELCTLKHGLDGMLHSLRMTKRATRTTTTTKMDVDDDDDDDDDDGFGPQTQTLRRRERQRKNGGKHFSATMVNQCIDNAIKELFEHVHAPSLAHGDRQRFYAVVEEVLREFPRAMVLGGDFEEEEEEENASNAKEEDEKRKKAVGRLESIVANCDGERDPRNVLALCRLWQELPKAFNEAEGEEDVVATNTTTAQVFVANCEEVYDIVAAYFPISFKPPQNDSVKITREELASELKAAMTATNCYAPFAIPHVLESVVSSGEDEGVATAVSGEACADAIDCLETMGANWPDDDIATDEICANVWSRLRLCVISPRDLEWSKPVRRATARLFANGDSTFSKKILKLALEDQSVKACEQAFKAYKAHKMELHKDTSMMMELNSKEEKEEHAMEVDGEKENEDESSGCCGGGCGKTQHQAPPESDEIETAARVAAAVAGRCLGAAAAANVDAAKVATSEKLKKLLDAIRDEEDANTDNNTNRDNMPDWRSIAMVLITTTIGGALDAALASSSSSSSNSSVEEILGSELCDILRDTLVSGLRSFTCKAKDHDGVVLSIACASAYLQFPEFSKNGCGNAKKKAYADVLEALFWGATTASNEELVFSNSSTKKTKDDISSPTLADEAGDRRLRIKDAVVIAINSDKSNGTLAGQLISSLIKKALFDESTGHADRRRRALELCLAIVITNEKNANSVGQRSFRENIVGELAKLIAENPALRLRATTASDCLLACLRGRALEKEIILAPGETPQNMKTSEDALSAELCARFALGALGFGLPEMNSNFACATMACSSSEAQIALVGLCASIILGQAKGNFENACASLCGARAVVLSDENNKLLKLTVQRLVDVACAKKPYDAYSSPKRRVALHALTSMVHKRGLDRFFASEENTLFSQSNVQKMVFDNEETSGLLLRSLLFSPDAKTALNAAKIELVSEAFLQLLLDKEERAKHVAAAFYRAIEEEEKKRYGCTIDDDEEGLAYLLAGSSSSLSPLVSLSTSLLGFRSFEHGFRKPVRAQRYVTETTKRIRELAKNKVQPHIASAIVALASSSSALVSSSLANGDNCDFLLSCAVTVLKTTTPTTTTTISKETSDTIPTGASLIASTFFNSSSTYGKDLVEKHASKLLLSLCAACKSPSATVDFKVRALYTLAKCGNALPFNAIYPSRFEVYENCRAFLDDPRRRVRRSAAKSCSSWAPLCSKI